jgi:hypothetical protein
MVRSGRVSTQTRLVQVIVVVAALSMLITGVWMRIDPASFAKWANWPNHVHFLHDAGVFQIGIGMTMLFALWWRDVIAVVLAGFVAANTLPAINHAVDRDGGRPSDYLGCLMIDTSLRISHAKATRELNWMPLKPNLRGRARQIRRCHKHIRRGVDEFEDQ